MTVFGIEKLLRIPYSSLTIPPLSVLSLALFGALGIAVLLTGRISRLKFLLPLLALAFIASAAYPVIRKSGGHELIVSFLDAGDNRNIVFFELPSGKNILIDGGFSNLDRNGYIERNVVGRFLLHSGISKIDYLILSSTDKDHMSGAKYLLENFDVKTVYTNGDKLEGALWEIIKNDGIAWKDLTNIVDISLEDDCRFEILKPGGNFVIKDSSLPRPLAIKISYKDESFLTGEDLDDSSVQSALTGSYGEILRSNVLSMTDIEKDTAFPGFLRVVSPQVLVTDELGPSSRQIDPALEILKTNTTFFETAKDGAVTVRTDGLHLSVKSYTGEETVNLQ